MRISLIKTIKLEIESSLRSYLREEGIELSIAANDNRDLSSVRWVELETIEDTPLEGSMLLSEIKVIMAILGKPCQCEALIEGIYEALHPHHITQRELSVLLMSLRIESMHCVRPRHAKKRAIMRYVIEEKRAPETPTEELPQEEITEAEYCQLQH